MNRWGVKIINTKKIYEFLFAEEKRQTDVRKQMRHVPSLKRMDKRNHLIQLSLIKYDF